jgi:hypothetical protein
VIRKPDPSSRRVTAHIRVEIARGIPMLLFSEDVHLRAASLAVELGAIESSP